MPTQGKLEMITGAESGHQDLRLYDERNTEVARMDNNDAMLGAYPVENGYRIHVGESEAARHIADDDD